jgi:hypothetical protein
LAEIGVEEGGVKREGWLRREGGLKGGSVEKQ